MLASQLTAVGGALASQIEQKGEGEEAEAAAEAASRGRGTAERLGCSRQRSLQGTGDCLRA